MDEYSEYLCSIGLSRRTIEEYARELRRCRGWMARYGYDLASAPASVIGSYAETRPRSWSTRKMVRSTLVHYWTMTGRPRPPVAAIRVPPKPRARCRALDEADSRTLAMAAVARGDDPGLAVALMLFAALRRTEVARLRWECFDSGMEWVTIRGKFDVEGTVPVHARLRTLLEAKGRGESWVFPGRSPGTPSTSHRIYHWVLRVAEDAGVRDVTPHRCRHVALSTVVDATGDLKHAAAFARHADSRSIDTYSRVTSRRLLAAVASIDY